MFGAVQECDIKEVKVIPSSFLLYNLCLGRSNNAISKRYRLFHDQRLTDASSCVYLIVYWLILPWIFIWPSLSFIKDESYDSLWMISVHVGNLTFYSPAIVRKRFKMFHAYFLKEIQRLMLILKYHKECSETHAYS